MDLPGGNRKSGGYEEHLGTSERLGAIELRKPEVVADTQADGSAKKTCRHDSLPWFDVARLLELMLLVDAHVEQVHLVVASHHLTVRAEDQASIRHFRGVGGLERYASPHDGHSVLDGKFPQALDAGTVVQVFGHSNLLSLGADEWEVLGEGNELRPAVHGLFHQSACPDEIGVPITGGAHLDRGNTHGVSNWLSLHAASFPLFPLQRQVTS